MQATYAMLMRSDPTWRDPPPMPDEAALWRYLWPLCALLAVIMLAPVVLLLVLMLRVAN